MRQKLSYTFTRLIAVPYYELGKEKNPTSIFTFREGHDSQGCSPSRCHLLTPPKLQGPSLTSALPRPHMLSSQTWEEAAPSAPPWKNTAQPQPAGLPLCPGDGRRDGPKLQVAALWPHWPAHCQQTGPNCASRPQV